MRRRRDVRSGSLGRLLKGIEIRATRRGLDIQAKDYLFADKVPRHAGIFDIEVQPIEDEYSRDTHLIVRHLDFCREGERFCDSVKGEVPGDSKVSPFLLDRSRDESGGRILRDGKEIRGFQVGS